MIDADKPNITLIVFLLLYLAAALATFIGSVYCWATKNPLIIGIITPDFYIPTLLLSILMLANVACGLLGAFRPCRFKLYLKIFAVSVTFIVIFQLCVGIYIWFHSLSMREFYPDQWVSWTVPNKGKIERMGKCCGYFNSRNHIVITKQCNLGVPLPGCEEYIVHYAGWYLVNVYTPIFSFIAVEIMALMATASLLQKVSEQIRIISSVIKNAT